MQRIEMSGKRPDVGKESRWWESGKMPIKQRGKIDRIYEGYAWTREDCAWTRENSEWMREDPELTRDGRSALDRACE